MSRIKHLQTLIKNHSLHLQKLKERQALEGINTPPHVLIRIDEIEAILEDLTAELEELRRKQSPKSTQQPVAKLATNKGNAKDTVLVVDDHPTWRDMLAEILLNDEYEVIDVETYQAALEAVQHQNPPFQVAVVDLNLNYAGKARSNEDGLRLAADIRRQSPTTSVIILTGYATARTARIAIRNLEVFDYIEKFSAEGKIFDHVQFRETIRRAAAEARRKQAS